MKYNITNELSLIKSIFKDTKVTIRDNKVICLTNEEKKILNNIILSNEISNNELTIISEQSFTKSKHKSQSILISNKNTKLEVYYQNIFYDEFVDYKDHTDYEDSDSIEVLIKFILLEHRISAEMINTFKIDGIVSDNNLEYFSIYDINYFNNIKNLRNLYENINLNNYNNLKELLLDIKEFIKQQEQLLIPSAKKALIIENSNNKYEQMKKYLRRK